MRASIFGLLALFLTVQLPTLAAAQDLESQEIMVTASRIAFEEDEYDAYNNERPAVGLRRTADFLVQKVTISGDTRDPKQRASEIRIMLNEAVKRAGIAGVELAFGEYILTPLSIANVDELTLMNDNRPDSQRVSFLVKARLSDAQSGIAAQKRIADYIESVPENGRAQMDGSGDASLSVVGPDSFRLQITAAIAEDANRLTTQMGENYAVEVEGLNKPVQWARSGPSEVFLFIPYKLTVLPRP
ncbi:TonB-dependent receptor [Allopontixanthobacter sp.]|uniref:TonB-dependent receptor n=1 Tax=Allopontixanthobacter sp. TaxID=2906452 RepID=UPI002AB94771|nr:TonB-dependent receptor [Allopontixanthobacter sp.]MDZ4307727.1 TonB-dependent receptor [Allopontixanthobacter sp.]